MKDFLGQELRIGDNVVIISSYTYSGTSLERGKVTKINKIMVSVDGYNKHPSKIIKIDTILNNM